MTKSHVCFSLCHSAISERRPRDVFLRLSRLRFHCFRNPAEMSHTCRGTISLHGALIHTVDACTFVVSNGGTQTFHIKASTEVERQQWVTALELAKARAIQAMESGSYKNKQCYDFVMTSRNTTYVQILIQILVLKHSRELFLLLLSFIMHPKTYSAV